MKFKIYLIVIVLMIGCTPAQIDTPSKSLGSISAEIAAIKRNASKIENTSDDKIIDYLASDINHGATRVGQEATNLEKGLSDLQKQNEGLERNLKENQLWERRILIGIGVTGIVLSIGLIVIARMVRLSMTVGLASGVVLALGLVLSTITIVLKICIWVCFAVSIVVGVILLLKNVKKLKKYFDDPEVTLERLKNEKMQ